VNSERWVLGVDTSAYTTSLAVVGESTIRCDFRRLVAVPAGRRGVRPQEAVFHHIRQLPELWEAVTQTLPVSRLAAVAASARPRPKPHSYLPTFVAGWGFARVLARALEVPLFSTSHQEGHLRAALGFEGAGDAPFWALHLSGGTTELLWVTPRAEGGFAIEEVGASADLYVGQLVDRIGVALGLGFPAGPALERLAGEVAPPAPLPCARPWRKDGRWWISLSGPEAELKRRIAGGQSPPEVAALLQETLAHAIGQLVEAAASPGLLWVVGGVAANFRLRQVLEQRLAPRGFRLRFASPELSRDNAVGVALVGLDALLANTSNR
jgi:N6-L-threonylcarbamoyladenine synthase